MKTKKIIKKFVGTMLAILLICSLFAVSISAYDPNAEMSIVQPRWSNINNFDLTLTFNDGVGGVAGSAMRQISATSIEGTLTVYENVDGDWEYVDSWYKSTKRVSLVISEEFAAESGVEYKAVFVVTGYNGTTPETISTEDIRICP